MLTNENLGTKNCNLQASRTSRVAGYLLGNKSDYDTQDRGLFNESVIINSLREKG
jgi:hypothetical protein